MYPVALGELRGPDAANMNVPTPTGGSDSFAVVAQAATWGSGLSGAALAEYCRKEWPDIFARIAGRDVAEPPSVTTEATAGHMDTLPSISQRPHRHPSTRRVRQAMILTCGSSTGAARGWTSFPA